MILIRASASLRAKPDGRNARTCSSNERSCPARPRDAWRTDLAIAVRPAGSRGYARLS